MAAGIGGSSQTYLVYLPDIWQPFIDRVFKQQLFYQRFFKNYSDSVTEGGKTIMIPHDAEYTSAAVTTTSGDITANLVLDSRSIMDIDTWRQTARVFADYQAAQVGKQYRIKEVYAENMAHALAKDLDNAIRDLMTATNITRVVNASTAGIKASDLEAALGIIESMNVPREECVWFFKPKVYYQEILAVQKLYDASQFGRTSLVEGAHDQLYGVPLGTTNGLLAPNASIEGGATRNVLAHNRAFAFAIGNLPGGTPSGVRMQEKGSENLRVTVVADIMYGVKAIQPSLRSVRLISNV